MPDAHDSDDPAIAAAFLDLYLRDRAGGVERSVEDYQTRFPGHEALIARELEALQQEPDGPAEAHGDAAATDPDDGRRIGHYELLDELGRGGQGVVYRARDVRLKRTVALKLLDRAAHRGSPSWARFRREAEVAARLDHPDICSVLDSGVVHAGTPRQVTYIAMRWIDGESLAQWNAARRGTPPDRAHALEIAGWFEGIGRALQAAHDAGIVHRDIKPGNLMLTPSHRLVLLDFGLARRDEEDGEGLTESGDVFGTPAYMSPEQLRGQNRHLDHRTDVYSLGATLFECLTGSPPFAAPTREALYHAITEFDAPSAQHANAAVPSDLAVVVATALEKDPARRYASAAAMADDLGRVRRHEPIRARPVPARVRAWRWVQRNRAVATLGGALLIVLAVSLAVIAAKNTQLEAELTDARAGRLSKRQRAVQEHVQRGFQTLFRADPTGAGESFDLALALDPKSAAALIGRLWIELDDPDRALEVLDAVGEAQSDRDLAWLRAFMLEQKGADDAARRAYALAGDHDTDVTSFLQGLHAVRSFYARDAASARAALPWFRKAVLQAPAPQFHYTHSVLHAAALAGDRTAMDEAAAMLEHHWPQAPSTHEAIAQFYMPVDRPRAVAALEWLLRTQPDASACIGMAHVALADDELDDALGWYDRGISIQPDFAITWLLRGQLHERLGDAASARRDYRAALQRNAGLTPATEALRALEKRAKR